MMKDGAVCPPRSMFPYLPSGHDENHRVTQGPGSPPAFSTLLDATSCRPPGRPPYAKEAWGAAPWTSDQPMHLHQLLQMTQCLQFRTSLGLPRLHQQQPDLFLPLLYRIPHTSCSSRRLCLHSSFCHLTHERACRFLLTRDAPRNLEPFAPPQGPAISVASNSHSSSDSSLCLFDPSSHPSANNQSLHHQCVKPKRFGQRTDPLCLTTVGDTHRYASAICMSLSAGSRSTRDLLSNRAC